MILYIAQLVIGLFIHFIKMPSLFAGHRPPQNYVHVLLGIAILALAAYEVKMLWCLSHVFWTGLTCLPSGALGSVHRMVAVGWTSPNV